MLTPEQHAARRLGIGGSDAAKILEGGEAWYKLWLQKTGREEPKPILSEWEEMLRHYTEPLNLMWYAKTTGRRVTRMGEMVTCQEHPILRCLLDGFDEDLRGPVDAKHVSQWTGRHSGESVIDWCRSHYAPQVMHQMICTGTQNGALSVIIETKEPKPDYFELDEFWALDYIDRCKEFWSYVVADKEPPGAPPAAPPPIPVERMRIVDMGQSNAWAENASKWKSLYGASKAWHAADRELKGMVEPDMKEAFGHGIRIVRDRRGLSIKELST